MNYERRISEPKLSKCGLFTVRTVKVGNKVLGQIETAKVTPGSPPAFGIYWGAPEVMRMSIGESAIHVTRSALSSLRSYGVAFIGCRFPDGSTYTAPLEVVSAVPLDTTKPYVAVPKALWVETLPPEDERVANTLAKMRIAGGRRKSSVTSYL